MYALRHLILETQHHFISINVNAWCFNPVTATGDDMNQNQARHFEFYTLYFMWLLVAPGMHNQLLVFKFGCFDCLVSSMFF